jgi:hypothetical protein
MGDVAQGRGQRGGGGWCRPGVRRHNMVASLGAQLRVNPGRVRLWDEGARLGIQL